MYTYFIHTHTLFFLKKALMSSLCFDKLTENLPASSIY